MLADAAELQPDALVTVKVYVSVATPDIVVLVPVPVVVISPGVRVNVHVPVAGRPLNTTLAVATVHVGWVIVPGVGAAGVDGCAVIITFVEANEVHPAASVTVYVYVPAGIPDMVPLVPVPVVIIPPGVLVKVHVPVAGNPLRTTLPVATAQVGCIIVPTVGAVGGVQPPVVIKEAAFEIDIHGPDADTTQRYK